MLKLENISKSYTTGDFTQVALDNVSVSFRDNEFVAILGPSGSGKTTLLNIIGGLDHYDSGNLIIDGISTKKYKDRDWDAYRNNRIGFVFQSYNLIPHQTVLANVELALTLSGVSREERHKRAIRELERVGLGEHINKKPNQLSGGQMQRVAIARALINDPEILLADEPTGALDSRTSVQIMALLTEIAKDRLVIMVTHNPELADDYATRVVNLADGVIIDDSDPFNPSPQDMKMSKKPVRRTSMSFLTALSLSFKNLMTKKGRTFMTAFAGSIGIIGIAAILGLSNGVNNYINTVEEETLSVYPLTISSTGFDISSLLTGGEGMSDNSNSNSNSNSNDTVNEPTSEVGAAEDDNTDVVVQETPMITRMFSSISSNDLASLKTYLDSDESNIDDYVNAIDYTYNVTPQIYSADTTDGIHQINPDTTFASLGIGTSALSSSSFISMSTDVFSEMSGNVDLIQSQYDIKAGHWPENYNECVLVLSSNGSVSDFMLYALGLKDYSQLQAMVKEFVNNEEVVVPQSVDQVTYSDLMGVQLKLVEQADYYQYDSDYGIWVDKSDDTDYMTDLINNSEDIVISGIVQAKPEATATALSMGIYYTSDLIDHLINEAADTDIVKDQIADPSVDVFTGNTFEEEQEGTADNTLDFSSMFTIDSDAIESAFTIDTSAIDLDLSDLDLDLSDLTSGISLDLDLLDLSADFSDLGNIDVGDIDMGSIDIGQIDLGDLGDLVDVDLSDIKLDTSDLINTDAIGSAISAVTTGFIDSYDDIKAEYEELYPDSEPTTDDLLNYYMSKPAVQVMLAQYMSTIINTDGLEEQLTDQLSQELSDQLASQISEQLTTQISAQLSAVMQSTIQTYVSQITAAMTQQTQQIMEQAQEQIAATMQQALASAAESMTSQISGTLTDALSSGLVDAFSVDTDAFADAFQFNIAQEQLTDLIMSLMSSEETSYDNNHKKLGYANFDKPSGISIYPKDFESKSKVIDILDDYNQQMADSGQEDKEITYTDIVGTLMSSVTTIVNMISTMLIAFVAISLIVSSIMIGVITYISVLERRKEIGILRAIGASKGDVSRIFNAETVIEGLIAGLLGVGSTYIGSIPANAIVYSIYDVPNIVALPILEAIVLVLISVLLCFIAGLIPSSSASRKDPVEALRSE
ncbi:MAG: ATP-binding cassette domain-containing protein [Eggerthellaceae bacterium]|nr:ATP-binding cassette domain-containing protein [Eggerthellaceae bacterium]